MTTNEMITQIQYNLDDPNGDRYTSTIVLSALNSTLDEIVGSAHSGLLRKLHDTENFTASGSGNTLPTDYERYINCKMRSVDPVKWCEYIHIDQAQITEGEQFTSGSDLDPRAYIWGTKIYLIISTTSYDDTEGEATLYYIKSPTTLVTGSNSELHLSLHTPHRMLAESELRITYKYGDVNEAIVMAKLAREKIEELNKKQISGVVL